MEERLENLKDLSFEEFEQENACLGEATKQAFHRIQLLLYGIVVKGYIYQRLSELPPTETVEAARDFFRSWNHCVRQSSIWQITHSAGGKP